MVCIERETAPASISMQLCIIMVINPEEDYFSFWDFFQFLLFNDFVMYWTADPPNLGDIKVPNNGEALWPGIRPDMAINCICSV